MPTIGDIRIFPYVHPPRDWIRCDGALLPITQFQALFNLIGVTYGGDGKTNFKVPDLRSRTPAGRLAEPFKQGSAGGSETHALSLSQMPAHAHGLRARTVPATAFPPKNGWMATTPADKALFRRNPNATIDSPATLHENSIGEAGSGQGHDNMQPFLVLSVCIAVHGTYPPVSAEAHTGAAE